MKKILLILLLSILNISAIFYSTGNGDFHNVNIWSPRPTNGDFQNSQNTFVVSEGDTLYVNNRLRSITLDVRGVLIFNTSNVQIEDTLYLRSTGTIITNDNVIDLGNAYYVQENGGIVDNSGGGDILTNFPILPVELIEFNAKLKDKNIIAIRWITATEYNNYGYYLNRYINDLHIDNIAFINGYGNSYEIKKYEVYDTLKSFSTDLKIRYELIQIDYNNKYENYYTNIVNLNHKKINNDELNVYPNPVISGDNITVEFYNINYTNLNVTLYDISGRKIISIGDFYKNESYIYFNINLPNLSSGVYLLNVTDGLLKNITKLIYVLDKK